MQESTQILQNSDKNVQKPDENMQKSAIPWEELTDDQQTVILCLFKTNGITSLACSWFEKMTNKKQRTFYKRYNEVKHVWKIYRSALLDGVTNHMVTLASKAVGEFEKGLEDEKKYWRHESAKELLNRTMLTPSEEATIRAQQQSNVPQKIQIQVVTKTPNGSNEAEGSFTSDTTTGVGLAVEI